MQRCSGSTLGARGNLAITATGAQPGSAGDILVQGSQLQAGGDLGLTAKNDISLLSAQNSERTDSTNSSKGGSLGIGLTAGSGGYGISVSASVNAGKGRENGSGLTHTETTLTAGNGLSLNAGRDTTLTGAQVRGDSVKVDTGRNLTLTSEQDSDRYDSRQQNASAGGSFTFGSMTGSASVNLSQDRMHSNWQSVAGQTGIFAGKGGFDVTAGEHTQLNGAVISSTAAADKNRLDTGTLGFSNIENHADYKTGHQSVGMSTGGSIGSQFEGNMANGLLAGLNGSGSASSVTKAAVSDGTLIIRDKAKQTQDVADLSRDAAGANPGLDKIFDKDKEQRRMETAQLLAEIGSQAGDIARTQGEIAATKAATEKMKNISPDQKKDAEAQWRKANPGQEPTAADITGQVYQTLYNREMLAGGMGTGGSVQQGISAATAAIQGLAGGDLKAALAGGSAPYLAELIKQKAPDEASRIMAHAAVAGVIAAAQGNSAAAGAAGAATTAAMGEAIKNALYGDVPVSQMSEQQKQTLVALGTVAAGLAGGIAGDSAGGAVAGAQAGQNEISNNMVGMGMLQQMLAHETLNSAAMAEAGKGGANEQAALALTKAVKEGLDSTCRANPSCVLMAIVSAQSQQHTNGAGSKTETVPVDDDLTGGKLVNPAQDENKGTPLISPDRSGEQGSSNTGNTDGVPDTGGNTTVTPISEQNKDDLAYLAEGRDNRLPIPESTTASNGLKVESNTKHTPGAQGFRPDAGIEPRNSFELFEHSVATKDPKIRLSIDQNGNIHRFFNTNKDGSGIFHWSGSTGDTKNKLGNRELGSFNKEIKQLKGK